MNKKYILEALQKGSPLPFHMNYKKTYEELPYIVQQYKLLEQEKEEDIEPLSYTKFKLYWETGDRNTYQKVYFAKRKKLLKYALLLWREPDNINYKDELENSLWDLCSEPMWALPAHLIDVYEKDIPLDAYPYQIDLFAAETAFALAETLRMCEPFIDSKCSRFVRLQLENRIIKPFMNNEVCYRFEVMANNWSAVCGGAVGCVGILLIDDEEKLTNFLQRAISCIEVYIDSFGADGVCVEGVDYWTYGFGFFVCFADYLSERTKGQIDWFKEEKVKRIALNQQAYYLVDDRTISFADGTDKGRYRVGLSMYLKNKYKEVQIPPLQYAQSVLYDTCYRFCLSLRDILWYDATMKWDKEEKQSIWLEEAEWFISQGKTYVVAAKGGHNGESHNHNDCGSFILYKNGVAMLEDLGAGLYDADYFSDKRYSIFVNATRSHNLPFIQQQEQKYGETYKAEDIEVTFGDTDTFKVQLRGCYDLEHLHTFVRQISHHKEEAIELEDYFSLDVPGVVQERFITHSPATIEGNDVVIKNGQERLTLYFGDQYDLDILQESYINHKGDKRTAHIIQATLKEKVTEIKCKILIK